MRIVLLVSLFISTVSLAEMKVTDFDIVWNCPHTVEEQIDLPDVKLNFSFNIEKNSFDFSAAKKLIVDLENKYPNTDFYNCLRSLPEQIRKASPKKISHSQKPVGELFDDLNDAIAIYASQAFRRGALPIFQPGGVATPSLSKKNYATLMSSIKESCDTGGNSLYLERTFLEQLTASQKGFDEKCKTFIGKSYAKLLLDHQLSEKQCQIHSCTERRKQIAQVINFLGQAGIPPFNKSSSNLTCCSSPETINANLESIITKSVETTNCVSLKVGESTTVTTNSYLPEQINPSYKLKKKDSHTYQAFLNIEFAPKESMQKALLRTNECLSQANPLLKGPNSDQLEIVINSPNEKDVPLNKVGINPKSNRATSHEWQAIEQMACPLVLHELLHLLGLADEYREQISGYVVDGSGEVSNYLSQPQFPKKGGPANSPNYFAFDCRVIGPKDSIMNDQFDAYVAATAVSPSTATVLGYCACKENDDTCKTRILQEKSLTTDPKAKCPAEAFVFGGTEAISNDPEARTEFERQLLSAPIGSFVNIASRGETKSYYVYSSLEEELPGKVATRDSLLYPAHFRTITQPGCLSQNATYYGCIKDAYKTSVGSFGKDACSRALPSACLKGTAEWLQ